MASPVPPPSWAALKLLEQRFLGNILALSGRDPALAERLRTLVPSQTYHLSTANDGVQLGVATPTGVQPIAHPLPPAASHNLLAKLCPGGFCSQPLLVAGEDLGWLWNGLYQAKCNVPTAPGHRPPLFFLIQDIERLWVMLHVQDWRALLADPRVRLFAGPEALSQFRASLVDDPMCPWPRVLVRLDGSLWPADLTIDKVLEEARLRCAERLVRLNSEMSAAFAGLMPGEIASRYTSGRPLKILGITSRYTTFLQYSMRDWLAAFERLGHRTRLVIEEADHQVPNTLVYANASAEFRPDLIVIIDHYRKEMAGLPEAVPVVMWVQDALPNIFNPSAGAAQGPRDYALGFAKLKMVREFNYPAERYMPAIVGVNEEKFEGPPPTASQQAKFGCDVSFVSHASTPAEVILRSEIQRLGSPEASRLLSAIFDQLRAVYDAGQMVTEPIVIRRMIDSAMADTRLGVPENEIPALMELFTQRINNALFRHQSLHWVADMGVNLHLYGRGWEKHPTLGRFARGVADHANELSVIYRASKISLQISPHGAVHQRVVEGLAAGGLFLMRFCPGDIMEREFKAIHEWCASHSIESDDELRARATPEIQARLRTVAEMLQADPFAGDASLLDVLRSSEDCRYIRSAGTVWDDDYDQVCFASAQQLQERISHYLQNDDERLRRAQSMRRVALARFTYRATSQRLLEFIANDMAKHARLSAAA